MHVSTRPTPRWPALLAVHLHELQSEVREKATDALLALMEVTEPADVLCRVLGQLYRHRQWRARLGACQLVTRAASDFGPSEVPYEESELMNPLVALCESESERIEVRMEALRAIADGADAEALGSVDAACEAAEAAGASPAIIGCLRQLAAGEAPVLPGQGGGDDRASSSRQRAVGRSAGSKGSTGGAAGGEATRRGGGSSGASLASTLGSTGRSIASLDGLDQFEGEAATTAAAASEDAVGIGPDGELLPPLEEGQVSELHSTSLWRRGLIGFTYGRGVVPAKPVRFSGGEDLARRVRTAVSALEPSKEWDVRAEAMETVRGLVIAGATATPQWPELVLTLADALKPQVTDLRSSIVRQACLVLSEMSARMGEAFERVALKTFASLLKITVTTIAVIATSGNDAALTVINNSSRGFHRIIPKIIAGTASRSSVMRARSADMLAAVLRGWSRSCLEKHRTELEAAVAALVTDADADARQQGRVALWSFVALFPDREDELMASLDAATRRRVEAAADVAVATAQEVARFRSVVPLPPAQGTAPAARTSVPASASAMSSRPSAVRSTSRAAALVPAAGAPALAPEELPPRHRPSTAMETASSKQRVPRRGSLAPQAKLAARPSTAAGRSSETAPPSARASDTLLPPPPASGFAPSRALAHSPADRPAMASAYAAQHGDGRVANKARGHADAPGREGVSGTTVAAAAASESAAAAATLAGAGPSPDRAPRVGGSRPGQARGASAVTAGDGRMPSAKPGAIAPASAGADGGAIGGAFGEEGRSRRDSATSAASSRQSGQSGVTPQAAKTGRSGGLRDSGSGASDASPAVADTLAALRSGDWRQTRDAAAIVAAQADEALASAVSRLPIVVKSSSVAAALAYAALVCRHDRVCGDVLRALAALVSVPAAASAVDGDVSHLARPAVVALCSRTAALRSAGEECVAALQAAAGEASTLKALSSLLATPAGSAKTPTSPDTVRAGCLRAMRVVLADADSKVALQQSAALGASLAERLVRLALLVPAANSAAVGADVVAALLPAAAALDHAAPEALPASLELLGDQEADAAVGVLLPAIPRLEACLRATRVAADPATMTPPRPAGTAPHSAAAPAATPVAPPVPEPANGAATGRKRGATPSAAGRASHAEGQRAAAAVSASERSAAAPPVLPPRHAQSSTTPARNAASAAAAALTPAVHGRGSGYAGSSLSPAAGSADTLMTPATATVAASFTPMPGGRTPKEVTRSVATARGMPQSAAAANTTSSTAGSMDSRSRGAGVAAGRLPTEGELASLIGIAKAVETPARVRQAALVRLAKAAMSPALAPAWDSLATRAVSAILAAAGAGMADEADSTGAAAAAALATARRLVRHQGSALASAGVCGELLQGVLALVRHAGRRRELVHNVVRTADEVSTALDADDALTCCLTVMLETLDASLGGTADGSAFAAPDTQAGQILCAALKVASALVSRLSAETMLHQLGADAVSPDTLLATVSRCMSATEREIRKNATVLLSACLERLGPDAFAEQIDPSLTRSQQSLVRIFHQKQSAKR